MEINRIIDHTLLKPESTEEQIEKILEEAKEYNFFSVCVNPVWVKKCAESLKGTDVKVCTVIGFPLGANTKEVKVFETEDAIKNGANEIDMVINIGLLKSKKYDLVKEEIQEIAKVCHENGALLKVILENCLLTKEEIVKACELSDEAGADFVKTSTGFSTSGADSEDVALMRKSVSERVKVKASGGIRDLQKIPRNDWKGSRQTWCIRWSQYLQRKQVTMNINPVAFTIFGLEVKWYGILIALGVFLAILITESMAKKKSYKNGLYKDVGNDVSLICSYNRSLGSKALLCNIWMGLLQSTLKWDFCN